MLKETKGVRFKDEVFTDFYSTFQFVDNKTVTSNVEPNFYYLSQTDKDCISESIEENGKLSFKQLVDKSHDFAWHAARLKNPMQMDFYDIAKAGGADDDMIQYMKEMEQMFEHFNVSV